MKAKKFLEVILTLVAIVALVLCTAESLDGRVQVIWSLSWIAILTGSLYGLGKLTKEERK
jgi:hypothetical protein